MAEIDIKGLPEGVKPVRVGAPKPGEYVLRSTVLGSDIQQCSPAQQWSPFALALIVTPDEGWSFVYYPCEDIWRPVRRLRPPRRITACFDVDDAETECRVLKATAALPGWLWSSSSERHQNQAAGNITTTTDIPACLLHDHTELWEQDGSSEF